MINLKSFLFFIIASFCVILPFDSFGLRKKTVRRVRLNKPENAMPDELSGQSTVAQGNVDTSFKEPKLPARRRRLKRAARAKKNNAISRDNVIKTDKSSEISQSKEEDTKVDLISSSDTELTGSKSDSEEFLGEPTHSAQKRDVKKINVEGDNETLKEKNNRTDEGVDSKDSNQFDESKDSDSNDSDEFESFSNSQEDNGSAVNDEDETIEFYFENTDLKNVVAQVETLYNVTFISDDIISPLSTGSRSLKGNKISFKTQKALTKKEGWNLFLTFLDIAGFAIVPGDDPKIFRITTSQKAQRAAIPSFIGVESEELPDNDQMIRYVYFIENINPDTLKGIVDQMLSSSAGPSFALRELKALILTDKSYNIKALMKIIKELDKVSMPQSMSVLKLTRADAEDVAKLYAALTKTQDTNVMSRIFPARRQPTSLYFPENVRVIPEKRSNSLILLGARDAIEKIENFVTKFIDVEPDKPYSPLHTYQLQYAEASNIATIMNDLTKFGSEKSAGKVGGVRGGDKYFKPMLFIPETSTNQLIIRGDYNDYLRASEVIKRLDEPQPQIAIEVLICNIELSKNKELGGQVRSKNNGDSCGVFNNNLNFQTGNLGQGIAVNDDGKGGCQQLLGNLLNVAKRLVAGNTVVSLGCDALGVWGILRALDTVTNSEVISNPFLLTTNKTKAEVSVGEIRRLQTGTVVGDTSERTFGDEPAELKVTLTPQINSDGMIGLDIIVDVKQFTGSAESSDAAQRTTRKIDTRTTVADNEVIALGGLIRNRIEDSSAKTPLFGDIPLLGWLFKNREKSEQKSNLLILVSTKIITPDSEEGLGQFTNKHIDDYYGVLGTMYDMGNKKDPLTRLFFRESGKDVARRVEDLLFRGKKQRKRMKSRFKKRKRVQAEQKKEVSSKKSSVTGSKDRAKKNSVDGKKVLAKSKDRQRVSLIDLGDDDGKKAS